LRVRGGGACCHRDRRVVEGSVKRAQESGVVFVPG
jgi:hypothetical protein